MSGARVTSDHNSNAHYRALIDGSLDGVLILETVLDKTGAVVDFIITKLNRRAEALLGRPEPEVVNRRLSEVVPGISSSPIWAPCLSVVDTETAVEQETEIFLPSIQARWLYQQVLPLPGALAIVLRDISQRKAVEEQLTHVVKEARHAAQQKSEFVANVSHEIRTPLNGILGMIRFLLDTELTPEQKEYCDVISESGEALLAIINDLLDLSRLDAGRLRVDCRPFDLRDLLSSVVQLLAPRAKEKGLTIELDLPRAFDLQLIGDALRIRQVVINLLGNAIKFTESGGVSVRASAEDLGGEKLCLRINVEDTGIGIPSDKTNLVFGKFSQIDSSPSRRFSGTGLGLAISRDLAELMGGSITFVSEEGRGSTFSLLLTLPYAAPHPPLRAEAGGEPPARTSCAGPVKVLVVEDNLVNQKVAIRLLQKLGCVVESVTDGRSAIERTLSTPGYDVVFMDCQMPQMDGYAATAMIRANGNRVPIIALTANVMPEDRERCLQAGMDDYISKPIRLEELKAAIERCLGAVAE